MLILFGERSLENAVANYLEHYHQERNHQGLDNVIPFPKKTETNAKTGTVKRRDRLGGLLDAHADSGAIATIGYRRYLHTVPFGTIERDGDRIVSLEEKPTLTRDVNAGIYALAPSLVARVGRGRPLALPDLVGDAIDRGEAVGAFAIDDDWIDVGQREQLDRAREGA